MFGSRREVTSVVIYDPGADKNILMLRVPANETWTIEAAYAAAATTLAAGTVDTFAISLLNGGTVGTGTTAISDAVGGTAGWVAQTPKAITITEGSGDLTAGQYLVVKYDEAGSVAPVGISVIVEFVRGRGLAA